MEITFNFYDGNEVALREERMSWNGNYEYYIPLTKNSKNNGKINVPPARQNDLPISRKRLKNSNRN